MPLCPTCGNYYGRSEFPTCYSCAQRIKVSDPSPTVRDALEAASFKPSTNPPAGQVLLDTAVDTFMRLHYNKNSDRAQKLLLLAEVSKLGVAVNCYSCTRPAQLELNHYDVGHTARLFSVSVTQLRDRLIPLIERYQAENPEPAQEARTEPVEGWRNYTLRIDGGGPLLVGGRDVSWPGPHLEALCDAPVYSGAGHMSSRERALRHLEQPLGEGSEKATYALNTLLPYTGGSPAVCQCGIYGMTEPDFLPNNGVSGNLRDRVVTKCYGWGIVHMGADARSWRASDCTIAEIWIPVEVSIDGNKIPGGPLSIYSNQFNWDAFCQDLADRYDCRVNLYFGSDLNRVLRYYLPPAIESDEEEPSEDTDALPSVWTKGLEDVDFDLGPV